MFHASNIYNTNILPLFFKTVNKYVIVSDVRAFLQLFDKNTRPQQDKSRHCLRKHLLRIVVMGPRVVSGNKFYKKVFLYKFILGPVCLHQFYVQFGGIHWSQLEQQYRSSYVLA